MKVTREVILDLLPVYLSGEASAATNALVEEYIGEDEELAEIVRLQHKEGQIKMALPELPPELELVALRRTRRMLTLQRWLFGLSLGFIAVSLTSQLSFKEGKLEDFHFLLRDYPMQFGICLALGLACLGGYFYIRRKLRTTSI